MTEQQFTTEELATEEWRDVVGYFSGIYSVSNLGRLRREIGHDGATWAGRILKPTQHGTGYAVVSLSLHNQERSYRVHAIVCYSFIGPRPHGYHVNHKDGQKLNNRLTNLEYVTPKENKQHASRMGLVASGARNGQRTHPERTARGERHGNAKMTSASVLNLRADRERGMTYPQLAIRYNITRGYVGEIVRRESWYHI